MTAVPLSEFSRVFTFLTTVFKTHFGMQYVWEGQHRQDTLSYITVYIFFSSNCMEDSHWVGHVKLLGMQRR